METVYQNGTGYHYGYIDISLPVQIAYVALGMAIVVVNTPVILGFIRDKEIRRAPTSFIILHLSIVNLIQGVLKISNCYWLIYGTVIPTRDNILCVVSGLIHLALMTTSVLSVIHLSWDRLQMVSDPFRYRQQTRGEAIKIACLIWVYVIIYIIVIGTISVGNNTPTSGLEGAPLCTANNLSTMIVYVTLVMDFGLPLTLLIVLNFWVIQALRKSTLEKFYKQSMKACTEDGDSSEEDLQDINILHRLMERRGAVHAVKFIAMDSSISGVIEPRGMKYDCRMRMKRLMEEERVKVSRVVSRLKIFISVFIMNWLPFYVAVIWGLYAYVPDTIVILTVMNIALNAFINPFLYAFMSEKFKRRFRIMFTIQ